MPDTREETWIGKKEEAARCPCKGRKNRKTGISRGAIVRFGCFLYNNNKRLNHWFKAVERYLKEYKYML